MLYIIQTRVHVDTPYVIKGLFANSAKTVKQWNIGLSYFETELLCECDECDLLKWKLIKRTLAYFKTS